MERSCETLRNHRQGMQSAKVQECEWKLDEDSE